MKDDEAILKTVGDSGLHHNSRPLGTAKEWRLKIGGDVEHPGEFSIEELSKLAPGPFSSEMGINCVSAGAICGPSGKATFEGLPFSLLAEVIKHKGLIEELRPTVEFVSKASGTCGPQGERHRTALPLQTCLDPAYGVMLAWRLNGRPLPYQNGGPLRSVVGPELFFYKAIKWLDQINILDKPLGDCRGTWETYAGYHNRARVEMEERFEPQMHLVLDVERDSGDVTRPITDQKEQRSTFERLYSEKNLSRLIVSQLHAIMKPNFPKDYSGCAFSDDRFQAKMRGTNFAGAVFYEAQMSGANFSLSKFSNARFSRNGQSPADLSGCDFEGAHFNNAHLQGVSMEGACLANAVFVLKSDLDKPTDRVKGLILRRVTNLDGSTAAWLKRNGAILD